MSRLLLGDDLTLYEDGVELGPVPAPVVPVASEIPIHDGRYMGRVLTVAADGTLTWTLLRNPPVTDASVKNCVLYTDDNGVMMWLPFAGALEEVISTDGTSDAPIYYGPPATPPLAPVLEGSVWFVTRLAVTGVAVPPVTVKPVVTVT